MFIYLQRIYWSFQQTPQAAAPYAMSSKLITPRKDCTVNQDICLWTQGPPMMLCLRLERIWVYLCNCSSTRTKWLCCWGWTQTQSFFLSSITHDLIKWLILTQLYFKSIICTLCLHCVKKPWLYKCVTFTHFNLNLKKTVNTVRLEAHLRLWMMVYLLSSYSQSYIHSLRTWSHINFIHPSIALICSW